VVGAPIWLMLVPPTPSGRGFCAVLNYMLAEFGGAEVGSGATPPFLPPEVAARRGAGLGPQEVGAQR